MTTLEGRTAIVTGAASGIGRSLVVALAREDVATMAADVDADAVASVAAELSRQGATVLAATCDVSAPGEVRRLIALATTSLGGVDLFFANAGISGLGGAGLAPDDDDWARTMAVNFQAHVYAARELVPAWIERGGGHFVTTASAAGLLTQIGSAPYSVSKHAAVAFAEWLAITYGDRGVRVTCLCPQGVNTEMLASGRRSSPGLAAALIDRGVVLEPDYVADVVLEAVRNEHFLALPHEAVLVQFQRKAADYERWLRGMRRLQRQVDTPA